ncbi:MAG: nuclear transport factor 2 family protein [Acidobacteria bacterium]|jgi:ketosteroid isomerase-like protein|nr:nuclear transport factor 2 family protein [Acidobacteriota bacterium]
MKRIFLTMAIIVAVTTFVFGQSKDEQEIRKMFAANADALLKSDMNALPDYYADSFTFTAADGTVINKMQFLDFVKNRKRSGSFNFDDLSVRTFGNAAVVNFTRTSTTIDNDDSKINSKSRDTAMLVKTGGRWQYVAIQISKELADDQAAAEKQIGELMTNWGNALGRRDAAAVEKILPADLMIVSPDGKMVTSRAEYLEVVKSFPSDATVTGKSEKTIVSGDTAVQTGTYSVTPKAGGANTMNYKYTATFVRRGGR